MTLRAVCNEHNILGGLLYFKFVAGLLPDISLAISQAFHCNSSLHLLFQLCHGGLFWKCILTKVSYATLT